MHIEAMTRLNGKLAFHSAQFVMHFTGDHRGKLEALADARAKSVAQKSFDR